MRNRGYANPPALLTGRIEFTENKSVTERGILDIPNLVEETGHIVLLAVTHPVLGHLINDHTYILKRY